MIVEALRSVGEINSLFAVQTTKDDEPASWRPATALCRADSPDVARLVAAVGDRLGAPERRVAASMVVLGYSARLVAPSVALLVRAGVLLGVRPTEVWWRYSPGEGFRLCLPAPSGSSRPDAEAWETRAGRWRGEVIDGHLRPIIASVRAVAPVAAGLLWGNVASSLAGALRMLSLTGAAPLAACDAVGQALLAQEPLRGAGELTALDGQLFFVRRSCCLYYRLPGGGWCGDCPLPRPSAPS